MGVGTTKQFTVMVIMAAEVMMMTMMSSCRGSGTGEGRDGGGGNGGSVHGDGRWADDASSEVINGGEDSDSDTGTVE